MEKKKDVVRIEHQVIGDDVLIDFMVVMELYNNQFNPNWTYRVDIPFCYNEDRKIYKHYPFLHN